MKKNLIFISYTILFITSLYSQYIGMVSLAESNYIQKIIMDSEGNIQISDVYLVGRRPDRMDITNVGLVLIGNETYELPNYLTLSVLDINDTGNISKIRDFDLSGRAYEVKVTKDNKYCLITHSVENNPQYEWGITVFELMENDINPYKRQFFPDEMAGELAISETGLVFSLEISYIRILKIDNDGVLMNTGQLINLSSPLGEIEVAPDNKYAYVANDGPGSGLVVLEIGTNNNVTLKGRANGGSMDGCGELIVSKDSKTVLLIGIQGMEVYNVQENVDVVFNGQYFWLPLAQSAAITPDGKFVVVAYDYHSYDSTLAVFRMNSDGTVTNLNKDIIFSPFPGEMKFYQLPTPSVDIDWKVYE